MNTNLIKLPEVIEKEFVKSLRKGRVLILGIGTFYISEFRKKSHPSLISNGGEKRYSMKGKTISRINFKPHKELKSKL